MRSVGGALGRSAAGRAPAPLVVLAVVEEAGCDNHVGVTVTVDVSGGADGVPEPGTCLVALDCPVSAGRQPGGRSVVDQGASLVRFRPIESWSTDDDVRESVAVDVSGRAHGSTELRLRLVPLCPGVSITRGSNPNSRAAMP